MKIFGASLIFVIGLVVGINYFKNKNQNQQPNIILISVDTLRADRLGAYGNTKDTSPFFDSLAKKGILFKNAFSNSNTTLASHMSLFTGTYPITHKVYNLSSYISSKFNFTNSKLVGRVYLDETTPTLGEIFKTLNYKTAFFADKGNSWLHPAYGFARGIDYLYPFSMDDNFSASVVVNWLKNNNNTPTFTFIHSFRVHDPYLLSDSVYKKFSAPKYSGNIVGRVDRFHDLNEKHMDRTLNQLCDSENKFMSTINICDFSKPHFYKIFSRIKYWQDVRPDNAEDVQQLSNLYDGTVNEVDKILEYFINSLEKEDLLDNTIIIFTADHGEAFNEHGTLSHYSHNKEVLNVPLLFVFPKNDSRFQRNVVLSQLVQSVDIFPTLVELTGATRPDKIDGQSLVPLFENPSYDPKAKLFSLGLLPNESFSIRHEEWSYLYNIDGQEELYHIKSDPLETKNLAQENKEMTFKLKQELKTIITNSGEIF